MCLGRRNNACPRWDTLGFGQLPEHPNSPCTTVASSLLSIRAPVSFSRIHICISEAMKHRLNMLRWLWEKNLNPCACWDQRSHRGVASQPLERSSD